MMLVVDGKHILEIQFHFQTHDACIMSVNVKSVAAYSTILNLFIYHTHNAFQRLHMMYILQPVYKLCMLYLTLFGFVVTLIMALYIHSQYSLWFISFLVVKYKFMTFLSNNSVCNERPNDKRKCLTQNSRFLFNFTAVSAF